MITLKVFLFKVLAVGVDIYFYIVLAYCVATFFVRNRYAPWFVFLSDLVEPPLVWIRKVTKGQLSVGNFDLAPIVLIILIQIVVRLLYRLAF